MKAHRLDRKKVTQTSATEIASALCDDMGIKASKVRFEEPKIGIAGYYLHSDQTISLCGQRNQNISVLLHELAHHLHLNTSLLKRMGIGRSHGSGFYRRLDKVIDAWDSSAHSRAVYPDIPAVSPQADIRKTAVLITAFSLVLFLLALKRGWRNNPPCPS